MATTTVHVDARPSAVFAALTTPETYPSWLIGCKDIRAVDDGWPAVGTRFHHRVGVVGPLSVDDSTKVLEIEEDRRLVLEVRARPLGRGKVTFTLRPDGGGTELELVEHPLGLLQPLTPVLDPLTLVRNKRSLDNLSKVVEGDDSSPKLAPPEGSR